MKTKQFTFQNKDGMKIHVYRWSPEKTAKGIIQIAHGMAERAGRYQYVAEALTKEGFLVYANDHRGHGHSARSIEDLGYISDGDGFSDMVKDMKSLTDIAKKENPGLPVILLGHSMGSFLAQRYIQLYGDEIDQVVLSGTSGKQAPVLNQMGTILAKIMMIFGGRRASGKMLDHLSFGSYNKKINPVRTKFDWLTRDKKQVDLYMEDPYCGTLFPASFFYDLLKGMKAIHKGKHLNNVPKDLPIYILSGQEDPVGEYGKGVISLYETYKSLGIKDVSYQLYPGGRHEMFNETNKEEVIKDLIKWLDQ